MAQSTLPSHIKQLVDKKNYVIAIKTHAQEQAISLDEAKQQIDAYENKALAANSQTPPTAHPAPSVETKEQGFDTLTQGLDNHLEQENIKVPLIPRWVWRVSVIILVMVLMGVLLSRLF
ncbi:hypothetical protein LAJ61_00845 [Moraxella osloensis]|nr:hypothetical protein [Moraxella osloensis]UAY37290.1 hypothetical protein LAJ61_00845 [Moraxella osloensis]